MTARTRLLDYALLAGGAWLAWVLLFQWAGPEALSPPGATLRRIGEYLASAQFWPHAVATGIAFFWASPFGPLRFDYAVPLTKGAYDRVQEFKFGGGTSF